MRKAKTIALVVVLVALAGLGVWLWGYDSKIGNLNISLSQSKNLIPNTNDNGPRKDVRDCHDGSALTVSEIPEGWSVSYLDDLCLAFAHPSGWRMERDGESHWLIGGGDKGDWSGITAREISDSAVESMLKQADVTGVRENVDGTLTVTGLASERDGRASYLAENAWTGVRYLIGTIGDDVESMEKLVDSLVSFRGDLGREPRDPNETYTRLGVVVKCSGNDQLTVSDIPINWSVSYMDSLCLAVPHPSEWAPERNDPHGYPSVWRLREKGNTLLSVSGSRFHPYESNEEWCESLYEGNVRARVDKWSLAATHQKERLWACNGGVTEHVSFGDTNDVFYWQSIVLSDIDSKNQYWFTGRFSENDNERNKVIEDAVLGASVL